MSYDHERLYTLQFFLLIWKVYLTLRNIRMQQQYVGIPCYYDDDEEEEDLLQNLNDIRQLQMISYQVFKDLL